MRNLTLKQARRFQGMAERLGVSKVARSKHGFMTAFSRAGSVSKLPTYWKRKRAAFIKRHMAQVRNRGEPLFKAGKPTRRHLALIMWAATTPSAYKRLWKTASNPKRYGAKAKYVHKDLKFRYKKCDKRSIRTIRIGKHGKLLRICCPKKKWMLKKRRCKVGTKAFEMLTPKAALFRVVERRRRLAANFPGGTGG